MKFSTINKILISTFVASASAYDLLKDFAGDLKVGVAANTNRFNNGNYNNAMKAFNMMVAENGCKLSGIQQQKGVYNFNDCDAHYNKAKELGMEFRGHCLIWHAYQPSWFENADSNTLKNAIVDHITKTLQHYEGKIKAWDVVNEAVDDSSNGQGFMLRNSFLRQKVPNFIDIAFETARKVSPNTKLFYNDYNAEGHLPKSESIYNFVADLKKRNIPIDGVGLQYHVSSQSQPTFNQINGLIGRYCKLGLEVHITELDVKLQGNQSRQTEAFSNALKACLANSCCKAFLVWGVGDSDSWLGGNEQALLFNNNYQPKPIYNTLLDILKKEARPATSNSNNAASVSKPSTKTIPSINLTKTIPSNLITKTAGSSSKTKTIPSVTVPGTKTIPSASAGSKTVPDSLKKTKTIPADKITSVSSKTIPNTSNNTKTIPNINLTKTIPSNLITKTTGASGKTIPTSLITSGVSKTKTIPATLITSTGAGSSKTIPNKTKTIPATLITSTGAGSSKTIPNKTKTIPATLITSTGAGSSKTIPSTGSAGSSKTIPNKTKTIPATLITSTGGAGSSKTIPNKTKTIPATLITSTGGAGSSKTIPSTGSTGSSKTIPDIATKTKTIPATLITSTGGAGSSKTIPSSLSKTKTIPATLITSTGGAGSSKTIPSTGGSSKTIPSTTVGGTKTIPSNLSKTKTIPSTSGNTKTIPSSNTNTKCDPVTVTVTVTVDKCDATSSNNNSNNANCVPKWGQCGGNNYTGATCCQSGSTCVAFNEWYHQCV